MTSFEIYVYILILFFFNPLSSSLLPSSFIVLCLSSYTRRRLCRKRLCSIVPCKSSYRWVHVSRAVLFCQPHQQLFNHSLDTTQGHIRTNRTFTVTPYQVETQVTKTQGLLLVSEKHSSRTENKLPVTYTRQRALFRHRKYPSRGCSRPVLRKSPTILPFSAPAYQRTRHSFK